ncbi:unnamed protein product, partial [Arabidopsis halleri]
VTFSISSQNLAAPPFLIVQRCRTKFGKSKAFNFFQRRLISSCISMSVGSDLMIYGRNG